MIVRSETSIKPIASGLRHVTERHYDENDKEVAVFVWVANEQDDIETKAAVRAESVNNMRAEEEFWCIVEEEE